MATPTITREVVVHTEIPTQVSALYSLIADVRAEAQLSLELKMQLQQCIQQLMDDFNRINEMSKEATIEVAGKLIAEFESIVSMINSLRVQISVSKEDRSVIESRFNAMFSQIRIEMEQLS